MNQTEMESFLDDLYQRHIEKLSKIELLDILRSNIPYLPRILGMQKTFRIATGILDAYMDSFGEALALTKDGVSHLRIGQAYWRREIDNLDFYVRTCRYKAGGIISCPNHSHYLTARDFWIISYC